LSIHFSFPYKTKSLLKRKAILKYPFVGEIAALTIFVAIILLKIFLSKDKKVAIKKFSFIMK